MENTQLSCLKMSKQENELLNGKREDFKKYLNRLGVIEALTKVLIDLYEMEERPTDPLDYIRTHMTETINEREELKILQIQHDNMVAQIREMEEENMKIAKTLKELGYYAKELDNSKLITDKYALVTEE